ncbi:MAG: amidophosphoribosyltransferase [Eubacteriales bacterium]
MIKKESVNEEQEDLLHEECGVFAVYSPTVRDVAEDVYYGLYALQHRGQESCGITVARDGVFRMHKDVGLVTEVFTKDSIERLGQGNMAIGHVRYGTTGNSGRTNAQPITTNHERGKLSVVHNGNLTNAAELRHSLEMNGSIFHTTSDTEIISYVVTAEYIAHDSEEDAVSAAMDRLKGAYSCVLMFSDKLIALRDEHGFRPLCYGRTSDGSYIIASESCALDACGAVLEKNIEPGEMVIFDSNGVHSRRDHCKKSRERMCIFEYIYFARPDSVIDGCSVHEARLRAGKFLANQSPVQADIVIGVPDSGIDAAIGFAKQSGIPYEIGFIKNKYIGRTFISPGQQSREDKVKIKLNPITENIRGKRIVLVDDSIVRGTTLARTIKLVREAGAAEVHVRITAPPFRHPCWYGTDIDSEENLIANKHTIDEICRIIGADSLGYLDEKYLPILPSDDRAHTYCTGCFNGDYGAEVPSVTSKDRFE